MDFIKGNAYGVNGTTNQTFEKTHSIYLSKTMATITNDEGVANFTKDSRFIAILAQKAVENYNFYPFGDKYVNLNLVACPADVKSVVEKANRKYDVVIKLGNREETIHFDNSTDAESTATKTRQEVIKRMLKAIENKLDNLTLSYYEMADHNKSYAVEISRNSVNIAVIQCSKTYTIEEVENAIYNALEQEKTNIKTKSTKKAKNITTNDVHSC